MSDLDREINNPHKNSFQCISSTIDSTSRLKISKDIEIVTTIINQLDLIKMVSVHETNNS